MGGHRSSLLSQRSAAFSNASARRSKGEGFADDFDEQEAVRTAARYGLLVTPLSQFCHTTGGKKGIVLGLGIVPDRNVESAIRKLSEALGEVRATNHILDLASY